MPIINEPILNINRCTLCAVFILLTTALSVPIMGYSQDLRAIIDTSKGTIEVTLNERAAPTTVANFVNLAIRGFYE